MKTLFVLFFVVLFSGCVHQTKISCTQYTFDSLIAENSRLIERRAAVDRREWSDGGMGREFGIGSEYNRDLERFQARAQLFNESCAGKPIR